jgi:hypothetical protein
MTVEIIDNRSIETATVTVSRPSVSIVIQPSSYIVFFVTPDAGTFLTPDAGQFIAVG